MERFSGSGRDLNSHFPLVFRNKSICFKLYVFFNRIPTYTIAMTIIQAKIASQLWKQCQSAPPPTKAGIIITIPMPRSLASISEPPAFDILADNYHKMIFIAIFLCPSTSAFTTQARGMITIFSPIRIRGGMEGVWKRGGIGKALDYRLFFLYTPHILNLD